VRYRERELVADEAVALLGITMGFNQLGLVAGPITGGAFTSYSDWRWCKLRSDPLSLSERLG
jgi:MFS family permease